MFNGWMNHAGAEIANAARTEAYVKNLVPGLRFNSCWAAESLPCALGDGSYRTPALDPAPWFSENHPGSEKFLGFYPLSVTGIEDSTRSVAITELVQDGAVFSQPRRGSKEFRVRGLMIGADGEGLAAGLSWLRGALKGSNCGGDSGDCAGDPFCYMAYLPSCCDYDDTTVYPRYPADWEWNASATEGKGGGWVGYRNGVIGNIDMNGVAVSTPCEGDGAQRLVNGLIPGEWYRVVVDMIPTNDKMTLSVSGHTEITSRRVQEHVNRDRTEWVIDFVAREESEGIRVTKASGLCDGGTLRLFGLRVERLPERRSVFLPRFTADNFSEPSSWSWIQTDYVPGQSANLSTDSAVEYLDLKWINHTTNSENIGAGSGARRIVRGLEPGHTYTVYAKMGASSGPTPMLSAPGLSGTSFQSLGYGWYSLTFKARSAQQYIFVSTSTDFTLSGSDTEYIRLYYMRVDRDERTTPIQSPDQSAPAMRTLHGVTLLNGPNVIAEYPDSASAKMVEVEFSMAAARPDVYSRTTDINTALDYTSYLVPTGECVNGQPARKNLYTNPDNVGAGAPMGGLMEYSTLGSNSATLAYSSGPTTGNATVSITPTGADSDSYMIIPESNPLLEGHVYTISATFEQSAGQIGTLSSRARSIVVSEGAGIVYSEPALNVPGRQRVSVSFVMTGTLFYIHFYNGSDNASDQVHWSEILIERSGVAGTPFSGTKMATADTRADLSWDGTANQSTSTYTRSDPALIRDPDCVAPPVAPQPPRIDPECASSVTEWRRYWMEIPASLAGGWNESVPVVTLTTGENIVRDVRIRFYPNPQRFPITGIEGCDFCGEFLVSYIPKNTVMTIDAINKTAMADVRSTGVQRVMHLVSDADYGPINWPEMTCDMPYFMTVDIAPDEVLDVDVRLAVALKE